MENPLRFAGRNDHLKRLPNGYYRGRAFVHWSMTILNRRTGWLTPGFYADFREILIHTLFQYDLCSPIYCCMPDHFHLLWAGFSEESDQLAALRFFRRHLNRILGRTGFALQRESYDHVLLEKEVERSAFQTTVDYIARNPERADLIPPGGFSIYPFANCLFPGYPELSLFQHDFMDRFWRVLAFLSREADGGGCGGKRVIAPDTPEGND